ncbi:CHAT domain-containing protein [Anaerolineales bacterium HSG25]|nr:CHAT domain-containing protein [Anaerolineales bacterium HSG25]
MLEIHLQPQTASGYPVSMQFKPTNQLFEATLSLEIPAPDGEQLFNWLFGPPKLQQAWGLVKQQTSCPIQLRITSQSAALHSLPWELLRDGSSGVYLASSAKTPFSRHLAHDGELPTLSGPPLRVLVAVANPQGLQKFKLTPIDVAQEETLLNEVLHGLESVQVDYLSKSNAFRHLTLSALETALQSQPTDILHLVAHGSFSKKYQNAALALAKPDGTVDMVNSQRFVDMVNGLSHKPALFYLTVCDSASGDSAQVYSGLAQSLIGQAGIPAVVAMQAPVAISTARLFGQGFYKALFPDGLLDVAMNSARTTVLTATKTDSQVPVLFSRLPDNRLWPQKISLQLPPPEQWPHPIAAPYARLRQPQTEADHFQTLDQLLHNLVAYLTTISLSHYWQDQPDRAQLRAWLKRLAYGQLTDSLTVLQAIADHYQHQPRPPRLAHDLFDPILSSIPEPSELWTQADLLRKLCDAPPSDLDGLTLHRFLHQLLRYRAETWSTNIAQIDPTLRTDLLPLLTVSLPLLIQQFAPLWRYPLRYLERVDPAPNAKGYFYTLTEFDPLTGAARLVKPPYHDPTASDPPIIQRLYLCLPSADGKPLLNLHPFLIAHLHQLYFLQQAIDRNTIWYQQCATPKRYSPPLRHGSLDVLFTTLKPDEATPDSAEPDPIEHLHQANAELAEAEQADEGRYSAMPLELLLSHLSPTSHQTLQLAIGEAVRLGFVEVGVEVLLMALSRQQPLGKLLDEQRQADRQQGQKVGTQGGVDLGDVG